MKGIYTQKNSPYTGSDIMITWSRMITINENPLTQRPRLLLQIRTELKLQKKTSKKSRLLM
jgi:hypothetical protein